MKEPMSVAAIARECGVSRVAAWQWMKAGLIEGARRLPPWDYWCAERSAVLRFKEERLARRSV